MTTELLMNLKASKVVVG